MTKTTKEIIIESLGYDEKEFDKDYNPYDLNFKTNWFSQSEVDKIKKDTEWYVTEQLTKIKRKQFEQLRQELKERLFEIEPEKTSLMLICRKIDSVFTKYIKEE